MKKNCVQIKTSFVIGYNIFILKLLSKYKTNKINNGADKKKIDNEIIKNRQNRNRSITIVVSKIYLGSKVKDYFFDWFDFEV